MDKIGPPPQCCMGTVYGTNKRTDSCQLHMELGLSKLLLRSYHINYDSDESTKFIKLTTDHADLLVNSLIELIAINKSNALDVKLANKDLAYYHFLVGEIITEYDLTTEYQAIKHYQAAVRIAPKHPYYVLRLSETLDDNQTHQIKKHQHQGVTAMRGHNLDGALDYYHWYQERWLQGSEKIHRLPNAQTLDDIFNDEPAIFSFMDPFGLNSK